MLSKWVSVGIITLVLGTSLAHAQTTDKPIVPWANKLFLDDIAKNPTTTPPEVLVEDFGTVPKGTICKKTYTITNVYNTPLQIVDVRRSCGCLTPYAPEKVIQPNETAEFTVTMDTNKFTGANAQTVQVTFGPRFVSTAMLQFKAVSQADITMSPGNVDFGTVSLGDEQSKSVSLEYTPQLLNRKDWKITGVMPAKGPIEVDVKAAGAGLRGAKYLVTVHLRDNAPAGPIDEAIMLKTNDQTAPLIRVDVTGTVKAPLSLSTDTVRFDDAKVGETVRFNVLVKGNSPFQIEPVESANGVAIQTFPAPAPVQRVTVSFTPTTAGAINETFELKTTLGEGVTVKLSVVGNAVE